MFILITNGRPGRGIRYSESLDWTVHGSNPGAGKIFCTVQTATEAHPAPCPEVTEVFLGTKWPELNDDHPPPSSVGL